MDDNSSLTTLMSELNERYRNWAEAEVDYFNGEDAQRQRASDEELNDISISHPEFSGRGVFKVEVERNNHLIHIEMVGNAMMQIGILRCRYIRSAEHTLHQVVWRSRINFAAILVKPNAVVPPGTWCSICRGPFDEEDGCNDPTVIHHRNCRCRGLQIYGRECISRSLGISTYCPACRGNVKDDDLSREAESVERAAHESLKTIGLDHFEECRIRLVTIESEMEVRRQQLFELADQQPLCDPWTQGSISLSYDSDELYPNSANYLEILTEIVVASREAELAWARGNKKTSQLHLQSLKKLCENTIESMAKAENHIVAILTLNKMCSQAKRLLLDYEQQSAPVLNAIMQDAIWPARDWKLEKRVTPRTSHHYDLELGRDTMYYVREFRHAILLHPDLYPELHPSFGETLDALLVPTRKPNRSAYRMTHLDKRTRLLSVIIGIGQMLKANKDNLIHQERHPFHVLQDIAEDNMRTLALADAQKLLDGKRQEFFSQIELVHNFQFVYLPLRLEEELFQLRAAKAMEAADTVIETEELADVGQVNTPVPGEECIVAETEERIEMDQMRTPVSDAEWRRSRTWNSYFSNEAFQADQENFQWTPKDVSGWMPVESL